MMGRETKIEWCDSTLNLQMGCDGCELWNLATGVRNCYAGILIERYGNKPGWPVSFDKPAIFPDRLAQALRWPNLTGKCRSNKPWLNGYPRIIFLNDLGDAFTESLPIDWLDQFIPQMVISPHIYLFLTKRPKRMFEYFKRLGYVPANFWLLTTVTSQENYGRINWLLMIREINRNVVLGLSIEPLLGEVNFPRDIDIDWVIGGGESGKGARPCNLKWARLLRDQSKAAGAAFFWKQWGEFLPVFNNYITEDGFDYVRVGKSSAGRLLDGREWSEMPRTVE